MKKMLIIFSSVVLLFSLLIVPASAAGYQLTGTISQGSFGIEVTAVPLAGPAVLTLYNNGESYSFDFVLDPMQCAYLEDGVPELGIFAIEVCIVDSNFLMISCYDADSNPASVVCDFTLDYQVADEPPRRNETVVAVSVFDVFAGVGSWIVASLGSVSGLFWNASAGQLTILGVLAVAALGVGVVLGLVFIISRFLRFRS